MTPLYRLDTFILSSFYLVEDRLYAENLKFQKAIKIKNTNYKNDVYNLNIILCI